MNGEKNARHPSYSEAVTLPLFRHAKSALGYARSVDKAHAVMLAETGILPRGEVAAILQGIQAVDAEMDMENLSSPEPFEDLFFLLESRLIDKVGQAAGGNLHLARSRNDLEATVFRLVMKKDMRRALGAYLTQSRSLLTKAKAERDTIVVAFTHGQPAQPTTLGHYLAAKLEADIRHARRMLAAYDELDVCPLGAVAITTTGFPIDRRLVASLLGFRAPQENSYGCIAGADHLHAAFSSLRGALIDIGRFSQDLALWSNGAVAQIRISDEFCQVSSVMPQKRNPLAIEYIRTLSSLAGGRCEAIASTLHNTPFADMVDAETPTHTMGAATVEEFERICNLTRGVVDGLSVERRQVGELLAASAAGATELADSLVRGENVSFRQAHAIVQALMSMARARNCKLADLESDPASQAFEATARRAMKSAWSDHLKSLSPENAVRMREVFGGPGPKALAASLERYEAELNAMNDALEQRNGAEMAAQKRLQEAVASIAQP